MIDVENAYKKFENLMEQVDRSCNISLDEEESLYRQIEDDIKWKLQQVHADKNTWQVITDNSGLEIIPLFDSAKVWNENQLDSDSHNWNTVYLSRHYALSGYTDNVYP